MNIDKIVISNLAVSSYRQYPAKKEELKDMLGNVVATLPGKSSYTATLILDDGINVTEIAVVAENIKLGEQS